MIKWLSVNLLPLKWPMEEGETNISLPHFQTLEDDRVSKSNDSKDRVGVRNLMCVLVKVAFGISYVQNGLAHLSLVGT